MCCMAVRMQSLTATLAMTHFHPRSGGAAYLSSIQSVLSPSCRRAKSSLDHHGR